MYIYQYLSWCIHHHCPGCLQQKLWVDQVEVACTQRITLWEAEGEGGGGRERRGGRREKRGEGEGGREGGREGGGRGGGRGRRGGREKRGEGEGGGGGRERRGGRREKRGEGEGGGEGRGRGGGRGRRGGGGGGGEEREEGGGRAGVWLTVMNHGSTEKLTNGPWLQWSGLRQLPAALRSPLGRACPSSAPVEHLGRAGLTAFQGMTAPVCMWCVDVCAYIRERRTHNTV